MTQAIDQGNLRRFRQLSARRGAVLPLFTFLLPVLLIFCGFAINLAYMQQVSTELKIATDAAAHAGGRAMSLLQTTDAALLHARQTAEKNPVGGRYLSVGERQNAELQIGFGLSQRANNGFGRYQYTELEKQQIDQGLARANSVSAVSRVKLPLVFQAMNFRAFGGETSDFQVRRRSIATQVDRDVALVLDISGSMLWYMDETELTNLIRTLRTLGRITLSERNNALKYLYDRVYSNNLIYQIERYRNPNHALGSSFTAAKRDLLTCPEAIYAYDYQYHYLTKQRAPRFSRWYFLDLGVTAFLDILDLTDQEELVSLTTFNSSASVEFELQEDYRPLRDFMHNHIPWHGTAIGSGMQLGFPTLITGPAARPFAAKTLLVMTDGQNNSGPNPVTVASQIATNNNLVIHTVTFTRDSDLSAMQQVAQSGGGKHYHTDEGLELVEIFEEIANNLPTILTE